MDEQITFTQNRDVNNSRVHYNGIYNGYCHPNTVKQLPIVVGWHLHTSRYGNHSRPSNCNLGDSESVLFHFPERRSMHLKGVQAADNKKKLAFSHGTCIIVTIAHTFVPPIKDLGASKRRKK
ncbi:hypothetical protein CEXT_12321 [Caerostris extrusa]|uniref:Uncharacterized protein n=1 Tax=Caerostris extrusa TaxID=172846 RepID=A0AAV4QQ06_CAEEX|nr:hypothetical protein CEXT_12321 [Caerostris extrusa]